jgi:hypothetical protein
MIFEGTKREKDKTAVLGGDSDEVKEIEHSVEIELIVKKDILIEVFNDVMSDKGSAYTNKRYKFINSIMSKFESIYEAGVINKERSLKTDAEGDFHDALYSGSDDDVDKAHKTLGTKLDEAHQFRSKAFSNKRYFREAYSFFQHSFATELMECWPEINILREYYHLLSTPGLIKSISGGLFSTSEIRDLESILPKEEGIIDIEDLPVVFKFFLLVSPPIIEKLDHIVVDEAQDLSPLQYSILKDYCSTESFTIVGDIAQGIFANRGLDNWEELQSVFSSKLHIDQISTSYRSTKEIVNLANFLLGRIGKGGWTSAVPIDRSGEFPRIIKVSSFDELITTLVSDVEELIRSGHKNIGIITKSGVESESVHSALLEKTSIQYEIIRSRDSDFNGGIAIMPAALSKGLEFDAVLILNADSKNYDVSTEYDGRLLYVAVTRALHILHIYYCTEITRYFSAIGRLARCSE